MKSMHARGGPWRPGGARVRQPYSFNEGFGQDPRAFGEAAADAVEQKILEVGPAKVAAFIGEPVQGAGGVIIPPESYWHRIETICRTYGIDRTSDVSGKSVSVRVDLGGRRLLKNKKTHTYC